MKNILKKILLITLLGTSCQSPLYAATGSTTFGTKVKEAIGKKIKKFRKKSGWTKAGAMLGLLIFPGTQLGLLYANIRMQKNTRASLESTDTDLDEDTKKEITDTIRKTGLDPESVTLYPAHKYDLPQYQAIGTDGIKIVPVIANSSQDTLNVGSISAPNLPNILLAHSKSEREFIIAHETVHLKNKDLPKIFYSGLIAIPLSYGLLKGYDYLTQQLINFVIKKGGLKEKSRSHTLLTKFKKTNSWIANWCVTQSTLAFLLWTQYNKHIEKRADLQAAVAVGPDGGIDYFRRLKKSTDPLPKRPDFIHPPLKERVRYLEEFKNK